MDLSKCKKILAGANFPQEEFLQFTLCILQYSYVGF